MMPYIEYFASLIVVVSLGLFLIALCVCAIYEQAKRWKGKGFPTTRGKKR